MRRKGSSFASTYIKRERLQRERMISAEILACGERENEVAK